MIGKTGGLQLAGWRWGILCAERTGVIAQPTRIREEARRDVPKPRIGMRYLVGKLFGALLVPAKRTQVLRARLSERRLLVEP